MKPIYPRFNKVPGPTFFTSQRLCDKTLTLFHNFYVMAEECSEVELENNIASLENRSFSLGKFELGRSSEESEVGCYGELILLGIYNGSLESCRANSHGRKHRSKMVFKPREDGNGIKKGHVLEINAPPKSSQAVQDSTSISFPMHITRYVPDWALVRGANRFYNCGHLVGSWLKQRSFPAGNSARVLRSPHSNEEVQRPISSTISRYACRILADRDEPNKAYVFAAGFDSSRNIFLGEKATKWQKKNGECDGLTTNGVLILNPNLASKEDKSTDNQEMFLWREVSVDGDIYSLRETRSSTKCGQLIHEETNQLQDGTLIDLCGATLLWRTAAGLKQSPSRNELEHRLDELNAGKPQCPVNLNTLIIPRRKSAKANSSRQPYVYLSCGHVQGKHSWGMNQTCLKGNSNSCSTTFKCPICMNDSEKVIQLTMGMESAFHIDSDSLDYAFNPCKWHVASLATVRYWSRIPLPHGTNSFHPVCPFCTSLLSVEKPYVILHFS
uniref:Protein pellino n=1 Tax=Ditylenchus dipsaci TaxID=166011 RepID=A0A915DJ34_9BILA